MNTRIFKNDGDMMKENKKQDEPRLNYEDYYKLTGEELNGIIDDTEVYEIDKKLAVLYEDSEKKDNGELNGEKRIW